MAFRTIIIVLFVLLSILDVICGIETGCKLWEDGKNGQVCCKQCHPGNRRVHVCGLDPTKLCTPCLNGTFTRTDSPMSCDRCSECVEPQETLKVCHDTTDTICGCKKGYRCHTPKCEQCEKECGRGEQPVRGTCQKCPYGTFNNEIHRPCMPWTRCRGGYVLVTNGTTTTDNRCEMSNEIVVVTQKRSTTVLVPTVLKTKNNQDDDQNMSVVWICMGFLGSCLFIIVIIVTLFSHQIKINKPLAKTPVAELPKKTEHPSLMTVEQEECSFCQPQQEQGSSMESLSTQDSFEKLLPPV